MSRWDWAMSQALDLANQAARHGDVPVGCIILDADGQIVGAAGNRREQDRDATAHAEILAIREACERVGSWHLDGCTLVVTLEPCTMCAGAVVAARLERIVFGAWEPKTGAVSSLWDVVRDPRLNHRLSVTSGVMAEESEILLNNFFAEKRAV